MLRVDPLSIKSSKHIIYCLMDELKKVTDSLKNISDKGIPVRVVIDPTSIFLIALFLGLLLIAASAGSAQVEKWIKNA